MEDIFKKIELLEHSSHKAITDVWRQVSNDLYESKLDSRKMNARDFRRLQDKIGTSAFIVEVLR